MGIRGKGRDWDSPLLGRGHRRQQRQLRRLRQPLGQQADRPGGSFQPNAFGLHDMLGNVFEWTCSEYKESYDGSEKSGCSCERDQTFTVKLKCAFQARLYSLRGGSWDIGPGKMRSANRGYGGPGLHSHLLGFRLAWD